MHILNVKEVAEASPDFMEDLMPFLFGHDVGIHFGRRNGLRVAAADGIELELPVAAGQQVLAIVRQRVATRVLDKDLRFALFVRKLHQVGRDTRFPAVDKGSRTQVEQVPLDRLEPVVIVGGHGDLADATA